MRSQNYLRNLEIKKPFENWNLMVYFKIKDDEMNTEGTWSPQLHVKSDFPEKGPERWHLLREQPDLIPRLIGLLICRERTQIFLCHLTLGCSVSCHMGEYRLHCNIKTRNIEGFKHNFTSVFMALRGSEWTSRQKKVVILLITSQIIKYTLLPKSLHDIPIINLAVNNRIAWIGGAPILTQKDSLTATTVGAMKHGSTLPEKPILIYLVP